MTFRPVPKYPSLAQNPARLQLENYPVRFDLQLRASDTRDGHRVGPVGVARYFEDARMQFIAELIARSGMERNQWYSVIRQCSIESLGEMVYPGKVWVGCGILRLGNTSYQGGYGIFQHGVCVALSDATLVWIDHDYRPLTPGERITAVLKQEMLRS